MNDKQVWLTTEDASKITGYNTEHIRRLVRAGKVDAKKWGREWMIKRSSLIEYMNNEGRGPKSK